MKKGILFLWVLLMCFPLSDTGWAIPIPFEEAYLGTRRDANFFAMAEPSSLPIPGVGNRARFFFDLTAPGDRAELLDTTTNPNTIITTTGPSTDMTGYDPVSFVPSWAFVDFFISDYTADVPAVEERVRINIERGTQVETFDLDLEADLDGLLRARVSLDELALAALGDGQLLALAIAPAFGSVNNTFTIERVRLHGEAAPVPEPATMLLLGTGLVGLAGFRKKFKKAK